MTQEEWVKWTELTKKIEFVDGKIPLDAFYAWSEYLYTVPIEFMGVRFIKEKAEILMIHRKDNYYDGYHTPGAIMVPGKPSKEILNELIERELGNKVKINKLQFVRYYDIMKGSRDGENLRGQEINLVFSGLIEGVPKEGEWFTKENLPNNIIPQFKFIIPEILDWAESHLI